MTKMEIIAVILGPSACIASFYWGKWRGWQECGRFYRENLKRLMP